MPPRMYPDAPIAGTQLGEITVFNALKAYLPDDWMVFHSVWELHDGGREDEAELGDNYASSESDFVVLVPGKGFAVLEVKNWLQVEIRNGKWYHKTQDNGWIPVGRGRHSPLHQAHLAAKDLYKGLIQRQVISESEYVGYTCLAILIGCQTPDIRLELCREDVGIATQGAPCGKDYVATRYICGEGKLASELKKKIEDAFVYPRKPFNNKWMDAIRDDFCKTYRFGVDRKTYDHIMTEAGAQVTGLLKLLHGSFADIRVDGCAGSGKTVMLYQEAKRLYKQAEDAGKNLRILVLCYNSNLQKRLEEVEFAGFQSMITCKTFNKFCADILDKEEDKHLLTDDECETIATQLTDFDAKEHYDYVFIDEAQDFNPKWWEIVQNIPYPPGASPNVLMGKTYIFCDSNQRLYNQREKDTIPMPPCHIRLERNLRNAREIAGFSTELLPSGSKTIPLPLGGGTVLVAKGGDLVQRKQAVREAIAFLTAPPKEYQNRVFQFSARHKDITVLSHFSFSKPEKSSIAGDLERKAAPKKRGNKKMKKCTVTPILPDGVGCSTIKSFKGLEADYVILTDIPAPSEFEASGFTMNDFYVGCTRAKFGLIIIPTERGWDYLSKYPGVARWATEKILTTGERERMMPTWNNFLTNSLRARIRTISARWYGT